MFGYSVCFYFSAFAGTKLTETNSVHLNIVSSGNLNKRVTTIKMPNGKTAFYTWQKDSKQNLVLESIKFEGGKIVRCRSIEDGSGSACERAAAAVVIALGVCAAAPGSIGCWSATATATYMTYLCWKSTRAIDVGVESALEGNFCRTEEKIFLEDIAKIYKLGNPLLNKG